jgi:hypothetical protein
MRYYVTAKSPCPQCAGSGSLQFTFRDGLPKDLPNVEGDVLTVHCDWCLGSGLSATEAEIEVTADGLLRVPVPDNSHNTLRK